jgi:hypothetical protein
MDNRHEEGMKKLRAGEPALGDYPVDRRFHAPIHAEALRHAHKAQGYRSLPVSESIAKKFGLEKSVEFFKLLREREVLEQTNTVGQSHPIQDSPFNSNDIHFTTGTQVILPTGLDNAFNIQQAARNHVVFLRTVDVRTFDPLAENDIRIAFARNGSFARGTQLVPPSAFILQRQNVYLMAMPGETLSVIIRNNGAIVHNVSVAFHGWSYAARDAIETPRGVMEKSN